MEGKVPPTGRITLQVLFVISFFYLGNLVERHQSFPIFLGYFTVFFFYLLLSLKGRLSLQGILITGLIARFTFLSALPAFSDDFFRFIWDGNLIHMGISPYQYLPSELNNTGYLEGIFQGLNSPNYYSVYPPFNQLIFWISTLIPEQTLLSVNTVRTLLIIADIVSLFLLIKLSKRNYTIGAFFFLNPLLILESTGNLHIEGLVISFILLAIYFSRNRKWWQAGVSMGMAIATKLIPLVLLPAFAWRYRWKNGAIIAVIAIVVAIATMIPMLSSAMTSGMTSSLRLYFQSFEFNASWYYIFREIGFYQVGYNTIQTLGPKLAITTLVLVLSTVIMANYWKVDSATILVFSLFIYLSLSTTVHPWYALPLIPLGLLSQFYFPIVWSFFIFFTYFGYNETEYNLSMYWIVFEYLMVYAFMLYEIINKLKARSEPS